MAIAFDNATRNVPSAGVTATFSHTVTGTNTVLIVFSNIQLNVNLSCTYAGVPMTQVYKQTTTVGNIYQHAFILINPATGANNVVLDTNAGSANWSAQMALSYTGCDQVTQPDSFNSTSFGPATGNDTIATTVVAAGCWLVFGLYPTNNDPDAVVAQNNQERLAGAGNAGDSNGTVSTGSISGGWHFAATDTNAIGVLSIAPSGAAAATTRDARKLTLLGVG